MQVLKDEIKSAIIKSAKVEFKTNGFERTSMRSIAQQTGISVGNLYRYFKNKQDLHRFIVEPITSDLQEFFNSHEDEFEKESESADIVQVINFISGFFAELFTERRDELYLLLFCSNGTEYENFFDSLINLSSEHAQEHLAHYYKQQGRTPVMGVARPLMKSFFEGYFEILRTTDDLDEIKEIIHEYTTIYFKGFETLM